MAQQTPPPVDDLAPTPVEELLPDVLEEEKSEDSEEGDGDGEGGKDGKKGGGGKKPSARVEIPEVEDLNAYDSESLIEKLKMLVWAPFSTMVPGASSFEAETDLKRKLFLGQIGLITNQIDPHDIADPELINRLELRNQQRQEAYKAEILAASGAAAGMAVGLSAETPPQETKKEQRREQKQQISQPKEASLDANIEIRDDEDPERKSERKAEAFKQEFEVAEAAENDAPEQDMDKAQGDFARKEIKQQDGMDIDDILDMLDNNKNDNTFEDVPSGASGLDAVATISALFNASAEKTEYTLPEQKIDLKFADPAPKMGMGGGGMGGV